MKFTNEQRVYLGNKLTENVSVSFVVNVLTRQIPQVVCIQACEKVRAKSSMCDIKKQSKRIVLTDEKVRDIEARQQISPRNSLRCLAQETGVSQGSAFTATKLIKFRPYKITVVHELKPYGAMKILKLYR
jgi:hypothetical protein